MTDRHHTLIHTEPIHTEPIHSKPMHSRSRRITRALLSTLAVGALVAVLLTVLAIPAGAQSSAFGEIVDVNVVNVEVVVVDEDGRPVTGLTAEDFRLFEDDRQVQISNFYEVRDGSNIAQATDSAAPAPDGDGDGDAPAMIDLDSRSFVLFFDNTSLEKKNRKRVLQASRQFVRQSVGGNDFVKVTSLAPGGALVTLQNFTNDRDAVLRAIDAVGELQTEGNINEQTFVQLVRDLAQAPVGTGTDGRVEYQARSLEGRIEAFARQAKHRAEQNLAALEYLVRPIAGIPGQKAVIYFSQGLSINPAETLYEAYNNKFGAFAGSGSFLNAYPAQIEALEFDLLRRFEDLVQGAQESDIRFYAIDATGRRANLRAQAQYGLSDQRSYFASSEEVWSTRLDRLHELNLRQGLGLVATETGAALLADSRDYDDFLDRVDRDLNNFYSLGFQPTEARNGRFYPLSVETENGDYTLLYRKAYQNKTRDQRLVDLAMATLLTPSGVDGLGLALESGTPEKQGRNRYELPIEIRFPTQNLALVEQGDGDTRVARLEAIIVVQDEKGNLSPARQIPLEVEVKDSELEPGKVPVAVADVRLLTGPGEQQVAVVVRDAATGATSAGRVSVKAAS